MHLLVLEFKHIAPRAMGTTINNPNNLSGLCDLILVTEGDPVSDRLPTGTEIVQTGPLVEIPVADTDDFSLTPPNNIISLSTAGTNWLTANSWIIDSIDSGNSTVTVDISDFGYTHFPVTEIILGTGSQLTITSPLAEGLVFGGGNWEDTTAQNGHCLKLVTGDVAINDMFFRVTSYPRGSKQIGGDIFAANGTGVYKEISTFLPESNVDAIMSTIENQLVAYINWGFGDVQPTGNIQPPLTSNVAQVYSKYSNYNSFTDSNIVITDSSVPGEISDGIKPINEFWNNGTYPSTQNTFFIENDSPITSNVTLNHYPILNDGSNITATSFYLDNTLIFDVSSASSVNDVVALVNSANDWPLLQLVPGETDEFGNPNMVMLTLNPASTSVYTEFEIVPDECGTAGKLGLTVGTYDESNTYKANLEDYFADLLLQPDCPVINSVSVGKLYSDDPLTATLIGKYELPFDETFQELNFKSREEALAFNSVVNNLYFQRSTSDIRGLVNIKSNLEIELKTGITIGDKTVTYVDMNGAIDAIGPGADQPTVPNVWQNVLGTRLNTSDYNSFAIEYTIRESEQDSGPNQGYQRIGTMYVNGRQDFANGQGDVVFQDISSEMVDSALIQAGATISSDGDPVPALHLKWISDGRNIQLQAASRIRGKSLTMRYILRRWNSLG